MNKEYEDLLNYIASFERSQQQEEIKLAEEIARHKHSQQSIQNGLANIAKHKQALEGMQNSMKIMRQEQQEQRKAGKQLKEAITHLKGEHRLLEESIEKAQLDSAKKREFYARRLETAKERTPCIQHAYAGTADKSVSESGARSSSSSVDADAAAEEEEQLRSRIEQLQNQLQTELGEKEALNAKLAAAMFPSHSEKVAARATELEAELLVQREVVVHQRDLLEQQNKLRESTVKEFHDLDRYGNKLNQTYEELQQYCAELEAGACRCGTKRTEQAEDPVVHD